MFAKLKAELTKWQAADSTVPGVIARKLCTIRSHGTGIPRKRAINGASACRWKQIDSVIRMAARINALGISDI